MLREIASFLSSTYKTKVKLSGLIHLHRISNNRLAGSALRNLHMFKELCGEDVHKHIILTTRMWDKEDPYTATMNEITIEYNYCQLPPFISKSLQTVFCRLSY